jgi:hypothetical protein
MNRLPSASGDQNAAPLILRTALAIVVNMLKAVPCRKNATHLLGRNSHASVGDAARGLFVRPFLKIVFHAVAEQLT